MHSSKSFRKKDRYWSKNSHETFKKRIANLKTKLRPIDVFLDLLPEFVPKLDQGWNDGGLCPFHADRHAGSFKVNLESGAFTCFSCGASGGDILDFYQLLYECNFLTALSDLEKRI